MTREELLKIVKPVLFNTEMVRAILEDRKGATRRAVKPQPDERHNFPLGFVIDSTNKKDIGKFAFGIDEFGGSHQYAKPPCKKDDYLYVRETWCKGAIDCGEEADGRDVLYVSQCEGEDDYILKAHALHENIGIEDVVWKPSIHMPKEAARLFLKVTDVRVERLQDITEEQAKAEGISRLFDYMSDKDYEDWMKQLGQSEKTKSDWDYKNYLWHGDYGTTGQGNKKTDNWDYQYSAYDSAVDSFSSLWNTTVELKDWDTYGWKANPWVWVIEFERVEV